VPFSILETHPNTMNALIWKGYVVSIGWQYDTNIMQDNEWYRLTPAGVAAKKELEERE